jgi:hypothetical protein
MASPAAEFMRSTYVDKRQQSAGDASRIEIQPLVGRADRRLVQRYNDLDLLAAADSLLPGEVLFLEGVDIDVVAQDVRYHFDIVVDREWNGEADWSAPAGCFVKRMYNLGDH